VLVVVIAVRGVPASVVNVVDVIAVRNGDVTAALAVYVVMPLVCRVAAGGFAFVVVIAVAPVQMAVVRVVDVVTVRHRHMPAALTVGMAMIDVFEVICRCHTSSWQLDESQPRSTGTYQTP
jgi:hypothetical protein